MASAKMASAKMASAIDVRIDDVGSILKFRIGFRFRENSAGFFGGSQKGGFQKSGFGGCSPGTKTGTRVRSPKPPFYETALLSPSEFCQSAEFLYRVRIVDRGVECPRPCLPTPFPIPCNCNCPLHALNPQIPALASTPIECRG